MYTKNNENMDIIENKWKVRLQTILDKIYSNLVTIGRTFKMSNIEKKVISANIEFKNIYCNNERCFIIGNGPSIKNIEFSLLANEITFTVNQISRFEKFKEIKTNYHIWSDTRFFQRDSNIIDIMKNVNIASNPIVFFPYQAKDFIKECKLDSFLNIKYFNGIGGMLYRGYDKTIDYTKVTPRFSTVIDYAITLAIYMGIKEIYLLGCDCTGFVNLAKFVTKEENYEYAYEVDDKEKKRLKEALGGKNIRMELKNYAKLFEDYEILAEYCKKRNIKLVDCTENGLLDILEKKNLNEVLKN